MKHFKLSGFAMIAGGALMILVNTFITPLLPLDVPFPEMMASQVFLWRLSLAALAVFLLMIGSPGLYQYQSSHTGWFGKAAFALTFTGCALLFAHEWGQVFFVHELARVAPDSLQAMEDVPGLNLYDLEAMIAIITFSVGWICFAASILANKVFARTGAILVIAGFFAIPLLTAALPGVWGGVLGNIVLGSGWIMLGLELNKQDVYSK